MPMPSQYVIPDVKPVRLVFSIATLSLPPVTTIPGGMPVEQESLSWKCGFSQSADPLTESSFEQAQLTIDRKVEQWLKFHKLTQQWREARDAKSSVAEMAVLPAYQGIIGMGQDAIPLILAELKSEGTAPDHWFWALAAIADDNPVPAKSRGKLSEMANAWLEWGRREGYV